MKVLQRTAFAALALSSAIACTVHQPLLPSARLVTGIAATPLPHAVVPLHVNAADKAGLNVVLQIAGGRPQPMLFDTGSAGLWVYFNAIGSPKNYVKTGVRVSNTYSSGIVYEGTVLYAPVAFEGGVQVARAPVVRVDEARCKTQGCPAAITPQNCPNVYKHRPKQHPQIYCLEEGRGLWGTFGADLQPTIVATPRPPASAVILFNVLFGIAPWSSAFVVTPHALLLGPDARARAQFTEVAMTPESLPTSLPNGARGWKRDVTLCYTLGRFVKRYCVDTLFDTGAHDVRFETAAPFAIPTQAAGCGYVLRGRAFSLNEAGGTAIGAFNTGYSTDYNAVHLATPKPQSTPEINTGLTFYNRDELLFDARRGRVGFRPLSTPGRIGRTGCNG